MITFNEIYSKTNEQVLNHALRIIKNFHDSEDVVMKVFAKIDRLNKSDATRFNPDRASLTTWVYKITNTMILDYFRTNHSNKFKNVSDFTDSDGNEFFEFEATKNSNADSNVLTKEIQEKIVKAFHDLKPNYRRIGVLYFIREHTYEEISNILDMPMGSVKGMLSRCREKLQIELKELHTVMATV